MNKSEQIRALAQSGHSIADIARDLNIRYQFAYNVCQKADLRQSPTIVDRAPVTPPRKPALFATMLTDGGFEACGKIEWIDQKLTIPSLPKQAGVYAFVQDGVVQYVGVATRTLAQRFGGYARPGPTQTTNQRVNAMLHALLDGGAIIEIFIACPPDLEWNGFVISGPVGLEAGLILRYDLPWNIRGS
jgi:hypothetical protein